MLARVGELAASEEYGQAMAALAQATAWAATDDGTTFREADVTPEQIDLVESTLTRAGPRLEDMASDFYERLFRHEPQLAAMFTGDRKDQEKKFVAELDSIMSTIHEHSTFVPATAGLGDRHQGYGVRAAHYRMAGAALLDALARALGDDWTQDVKDSVALGLQPHRGDDDGRGRR